jgi:F420H(2)-dependent quinone reductase
VAYLKPPWFTAKIFNRIAMSVGVGGSETLTVIKRTSKLPQKIPVTPVDVDGVKYLVSTRGESEWVKNVRVNPYVKITNKSGTTDYVAAETAVESRRPILQAYKAKLGRAVDGYFRQLPDDADHPVFMLTAA